MLKQKYEKKLNIRTAGIREWKDPNTPYNRCESTPYEALEKLFETFQLKKGDEVVDFGVGRGRVSFYTHHKFQVPVTGIEVHDITFDELLKNQERYQMHTPHIEEPLYFQYGLAEQYEIQKTENIFYFFNPFSADIFKKVVKNIMKSYEEHNRTMHLILYYPLNGYTHFLKNETPFELVNKVILPGRQDKKEKFRIYRLEKEED